MRPCSDRRSRQRVARLRRARRSRRPPGPCHPGSSVAVKSWRPATMSPVAVHDPVRGRTLGGRRSRHRRRRRPPSTVPSESNVAVCAEMVIGAFDRGRPGARRRRAGGGRRIGRAVAGRRSGERTDEADADQQTDERDHGDDAPREPDRPIGPLHAAIGPAGGRDQPCRPLAGRPRARSTLVRGSPAVRAPGHRPARWRARSSFWVIALAPRLRWAMVVSLRALRASPGRRSGVASRRCRSAR